MKALALAAAVVALVLVASRTAHARGCTEVSDVVGYEKCNRFGDGWSLERRPPLFIGVELHHSLFDPNGVTFSQVHGKGVPDAGDGSPELDGSALGSSGLQTSGLDLRFGYYFLGPIYGGFELGFGLGGNAVSPFTLGTTRYTVAASPFNTDGSTFGALLGARLPLGRLSLRVEAMGGMSDVEITEDTPTDQVRFGATRGVILTRTMLDVWATPNVTLSVYGATDALDVRQQSMGLAIEVHGRSFDGAFSLW